MRSDLHESGVRRQDGRRFRGDRLAGMPIGGQASQRRSRLAVASVLTVSGIGGALVLMLSGRLAEPGTALQPLKTAAPAPPAASSTTARPRPASPSATDDLFGALGSPETGAEVPLGPRGTGGQAAALPAAPALPGLPALPAFPLPSPPQLPPLPSVDWAAMLQNYLQSQFGAGAGDALIAQLQGALPPPPGPLPADFSGLPAAFAAAAAQPPIGLPAPPAPLPELPQLPDLPQLSQMSQLALPNLPNLPTPDQVAAALEAFPAWVLALPAPPLPNNPTP